MSHIYIYTHTQGTSRTLLTSIYKSDNRIWRIPICPVREHSALVSPSTLNIFVSHLCGVPDPSHLYFIHRRKLSQLMIVLGYTWSEVTRREGGFCFSSLRSELNELTDCQVVIFLIRFGCFRRRSSRIIFLSWTSTWGVSTIVCDDCGTGGWRSWHSVGQSRD